MGKDADAEIDRLPVDLLSHIFLLLSSFTDLAQASSVCRKWRRGVKQSLARKERLSFAGWKMDDDSTARLVAQAYNLKDLDISRSRWGCQITDDGLYRISLAKCISKLESISLWGITGITDEGVIQLLVQSRSFQLIWNLFRRAPDRSLRHVSRATSLQHVNVGGTFITDESLFTIANSCPHLKTIVLWSCRHVTESGLFYLVNKCCKLKSINVWGMRVPVDCFISLLTISPALQIKPGGVDLNVETVSLWPIH